MLFCKHNWKTVKKMGNKIPSLELWMEVSPFQDGDSYRQKNHNWSVLNQYGLQLSNYVLDIIKNYDDRFNQQIQKSPQPSEILDARFDSWNVRWPTLKARLDNDEQTTPRILDTGQDSDAVSVLFIHDLSTSSSNMSYEVIKNVADINLPAMGYASTSIKNLSYDVIN